MILKHFSANVKQNRQNVLILKILYGFEVHIQKQPPEVFYKKMFLKNFPIFTCARASFLIKLQA